MTWKKTWFSRILWVCQFAITALFLTGVSGIFLDKYEIAEKYNILPGYNRLMWLGIVCVLFFIISLLVFLLFRLIVGRMGDGQVKKSVRLAVEVLLFAGLLAGGLLYRMELFPANIESNAYYELAAVNSTQAPAPLAHGALYMYILLLHGLFLLVGNQLVAGIILQIVLQFIAACLIYTAVRRIAGALPAIWTLAFFMFAPTWVQTSLSYSPEILYLLMFGIALVMLSSVLKVVGRTENYKWYHYGAMFLFGICVAFLIYLDAAGAALLVAGIALFSIMRNESETGSKNSSFPVFLIVVLGSIVGFLGIFAVDALQSGSSLAAIAGVWEWLYVPQGGTSFSYLYHQLFLRLSDNVIVSALIFMGLAWGSCGFFLKKREESQCIWILITLSGIALSYVCPASGNMDRSFLGLLGMIVLAGKGVQITLSKPLRVEEMLMEENVIVDETVEETVVETEMGSGAEAVVENEIIAETEAEVSPVKEIKYIENPLPLPKKHVKKTMDYALEVPEEQLEFDIEIAEDDDFDF